MLTFAFYFISAILYVQLMSAIPQPQNFDIKSNHSFKNEMQDTNHHNEIDAVTAVKNLIHEILDLCGSRTAKHVFVELIHAPASKELNTDTEQTTTQYRSTNVVDKTKSSEHEMQTAKLFIPPANQIPNNNINSNNEDTIIDKSHKYQATSENEPIAENENLTHKIISLISSTTTAQHIPTEDGIQHSNTDQNNITIASKSFIYTTGEYQHSSDTQDATTNLVSTPKNYGTKSLQFSTEFDNTHFSKTDQVSTYTAYNTTKTSENEPTYVDNNIKDEYLSIKPFSTSSPKTNIMNAIHTDSVLIQTIANDALTSSSESKEDDNIKQTINKDVDENLKLSNVPLSLLKTINTEKSDMSTDNIVSELKTIHFTESNIAQSSEMSEDV